MGLLRGSWEGLPGIVLAWVYLPRPFGYDEGEAEPADKQPQDACDARPLDNGAHGAVADLLGIEGERHGRSYQEHEQEEARREERAAQVGPGAYKAGFAVRRLACASWSRSEGREDRDGGQCETEESTG
jgi:hypothetical protein